MVVFAILILHLSTCVIEIGLLLRTALNIILHNVDCNNNFFILFFFVTFFRTILNRAFPLSRTTKATEIFRHFRTSKKCCVHQRYFAIQVYASVCLWYHIAYVIPLHT